MLHIATHIRLFRFIFSGARFMDITDTFMSGRIAVIGNKDIYIHSDIAFIAINDTFVDGGITLHSFTPSLSIPDSTVKCQNIFICIGCRRVMFANRFNFMLFNATINNISAISLSANKH